MKKSTLLAVLFASVVAWTATPASANVSGGLQGAKPETRGVIDVRGRGGFGGGAFRGGGGGFRGGVFGGGARSFGGGGFRGINRGFGGGGFRGINRGFRGGINRGWRRHGGHWRGHRRYRRGGIYLGMPFAAYGAYYYNGNSCGWLYRKAVRTGSKYWWRRYRRCVAYYY